MRSTVTGEEIANSKLILKRLQEQNITDKLHQLVTRISIAKLWNYSIISWLDNVINYLSRIYLSNFFYPYPVLSNLHEMVFEVPRTKFLRKLYKTDTSIRRTLWLVSRGIRIKRFYCNSSMKHLELSKWTRKCV